ncbi:MAG: 3-hydroxyacyl-[acyl-carrier-protein] dehydratase FabZ [Pseudomonadales bacterium]|nr:MAG: 3-hydroxyacyl-[acyl-carrier-protein] dehydratase FabZ [Pseudomonadales bacterium]
MTETDLAFLNEQNIQLPMNTAQMQRYLPHRYPFIMIDRVTAIVPDKAIIGYKNVSHNEQFFNGHFPEQPLMPGVLMVEAMAQLAGILGFVSDKSELSDGGIYLFAGVDKVRFKHQVIPGDQLFIKAETLAVKRNIYKYTCTAYVEDKLACSAEVMLIKQTRDSLR